MSVIGVYQMKNFSPCKRERSLAYPRKNSVTDTRLSGLSLLSVVVAERIVRSYFVDRNRNNDMIDSQLDPGTRVHRVKDVSPTTQILFIKYWRTYSINKNSTHKQPTKEGCAFNKERNNV